MRRGDRAVAGRRRYRLGRASSRLRRGSSRLRRGSSRLGRGSSGGCRRLSRLALEQVLAPLVLEDVAQVLDARERDLDGPVVGLTLRRVGARTILEAAHLLAERNIDLERHIGRLTHVVADLIPHCRVGFGALVRIHATLLDLI